MTGMDLSGAARYDPYAGYNSVGRSTAAGSPLRRETHGAEHVGSQWRTNGAVGYRVTGVAATGTRKELSHSLGHDALHLLVV